MFAIVIVKVEHRAIQIIKSEGNMQVKNRKTDVALDVCMKCYLFTTGDDLQSVCYFVVLSAHLTEFRCSDFKPSE